MSIFDVLYYMILGIPEMFSYVYVWNRYESKERTNKFIVRLLIFLLMSTCLSLVHYFLNGYIKALFTLIVLIISCKVILNKDFKTVVVLPLFTLLLMLVAELIFALLYMIIFNFQQLPTFESGIGVFIPTLVICSIYLILSRLSFVKKFYKKIIELVSKINTKLLILVCVLLLMTVNFLFASLYYKIDLKWLVLINTVISAVYLIIVFRVFTVENKYIKMSNKYNTTLNSLKEYEEILDKYKIMNHENKNDLLMIRNMIIKKEKDVDKYIDKLIDVKIKDDEKIMYETSIIPSGGLRAVVYAKILMMKDKKIKNKLHVDKNVRRVDLSEYSEEFVLDLCRVISIYVDNAIEATLLCKNKEVLIELFLDSKDNFNISITNTYQGNIELSKIDDKGYTTKGNGRGYGLTLAASLLDKHKKMTNVRKIDKKTFNQTIIIKK